MRWSIRRGQSPASPMLLPSALSLVMLLSNIVEAAAASPEPENVPTPPVASSATYGPDIADELGNQAILANPGIHAIEDRVSALDQKVSQAGAWLDPTFSAEYSNMPITDPIPGQHPMSGIQFTLRQTFYWPGKIHAREQEAESRVKQEKLSLEEQRVQLRASVRHAYYRLALTRQLRDVTRENVQLVHDFIDVVRIKVESGLAAQHELLRLRVLGDQLADDIKSFDRDEVSLTSIINAALHRDTDMPIPTPRQTTPRAPSLDVAALARRAEQERPVIKRYAAEAETYQAAARRARREGYPDITLFAGYRVRTHAGTDPGTDFVSLGVSVPLPFSYDRRFGAEQRQNEKMAEAALQSRAAAIDGIRGELGRTVADWKRAAQQAHAYREQLIPEARLSLDATFASYRVNRADFSSLYQSELELLNFERTARMAESAAAQARVDAEAIVGSGAQ